MPLNLDRLHVSAFRGIRNLELPGLGGVNLFVGPNNSGKTTVLEAIATYCRPLDPTEWLGVARRREVKSSRQPVFEGLRWIFPQSVDPTDGSQQPVADELYFGEVEVHGAGKHQVTRVRATCEEYISYASSDSMDDDDDEEESGDGQWESSEGEVVMDLSISVQVPQPQWLLFDADATTGEIRRSYAIRERPRFKPLPLFDGHHLPAVPVATVSPFAHRVEQLQVKQLSSIGDRKSLLSLLAMFDEDVLDLDIRSRTGVRPNLYLLHKRVGRAPLSSFGDGMRRAVAMALSIASVPGGCLLIDEIETAIHVSALGKVFAWLIDSCAVSNVQLFATTHSLEALDAIIEGAGTNLERVAAYHLDSTPTESIARRFGGDLLHRLRFERGLDVR